MLSSQKTQQHSAANPITIMSLATSENLTQAYQWAGKSRGNSSSKNSIWYLRWNWQHELEDIPSLLLSGNHTLLARRYAQGASPAGIGIYIDRWSSWCTGLFQHCNQVCSKPSMDLPAILHENQMGGVTENQNEDFIANCYN